MRAARAAPLLSLLLLLGPRLQVTGLAEPPPAVVLAILARNAEHSLPHYLGALERLDYPRARLTLWCATDHNVDNTTEMLQEWLAAVGNDYAAVVWRPEGESRPYPDEEGPKHWTKERHQFLMELKQEALTFARDARADYILFADTDNILTNNQTLRLLVEQGLPVAAPMLDSQTYFSNFWCGITPQVRLGRDRRKLGVLGGGTPRLEGPEALGSVRLGREQCSWDGGSLSLPRAPLPQGYYRRTAEYFPTKNRQRRGCFRVPMVHSTFLVSLRAEGAAQLAFYPPHPNYTWPFDDIIVFAYSCQAAGVSVHVCNEHRYGYMNVPVKSHQELEDERVNFVHLILEALGQEWGGAGGLGLQGHSKGAHDWGAFLCSGRAPYVGLGSCVPAPKRPTKMGFDEVSSLSLQDWGLCHQSQPDSWRMLSSSEMAAVVCGHAETRSGELETAGGSVGACEGLGPDSQYSTAQVSSWLCSALLFSILDLDMTLNSSVLRSLGVDLLPGYEDPYSGRTLTKGEVGCFLSHYAIWEESRAMCALPLRVPGDGRWPCGPGDMAALRECSTGSVAVTSLLGALEGVVARGLARVVVFEDDVRFESNFKGRLERLMEEVEAEKLPWDLIYLGRKQVNPEEEVAVEGLPRLVVAGYSYWTLAYVLSLAGARKLLASQPLRRMLPVDEFLPIMFDQHPNEQYKAHFWPRDLQAFSARPLLAEPTHYAGDAEWLSDTETSSLWDDDSGRLISWSGSHKTLRGPRLDLAGSSGHSLHSHPRDEL
ncbi:hypothetical protein QTO34_005087 [Cnephaeus nilssonii]|uniref:Glycosyl transferase family 25 domain-containing protein n=1 Tax=Cnephaeus nilssonii TaxID=3371016 RepID=A0AA40HMS4_CNENI|nr:hypothetical protein QTO34_005087 [Eptesicus nilssonii]